MGKVKTVDFSETIEVCDLKVGRCRQLIEFLKVCEYWRSRSFLYHIFSRFYMFCEIAGEHLQDHWTSGFKLFVHKSEFPWHNLPSQVFLLC